MLPEGRVSVSLKGIMVKLLLTAFPTSRNTWLEALEKSVKMRTMIFADAIASMIEPAQSDPGAISRGAYQQRTPSPSRREQMASATLLSL